MNILTRMNILYFGVRIACEIPPWIELLYRMYRYKYYTINLFSKLRFRATIRNGRPTIKKSIFVSIQFDTIKFLQILKNFDRIKVYIDFYYIFI